MTDLTDERLAEIERNAQKGFAMLPRCEGFQTAAMDPATTLALIARLRTAEEEVEAFREATACGNAATCQALWKPVKERAERAEARAEAAARDARKWRELFGEAQTYLIRVNKAHDGDHYIIASDALDYFDDALAASKESG